MGKQAKTEYNKLQGVPMAMSKTFGERINAHVQCTFWLILNPCKNNLAKK